MAAAGGRDLASVAVFTAMVTPFLADGTLDAEGVGHLAAWLAQHGSEALVLGGTTGEGPTLSVDERHRLFDAARAAVPQLPLFVSTGHNSTATTIEWTQAAEAWGADGAMVVTPYYNKPPQAGLTAHFGAVAAATRLPLMLYNVPSRTGVHLAVETTLGLMARHQNVWAVKEASGAVQHAADLAARLPAGRRVFTGEDALLLPSLQAGVHGIVSVASHVAGPEIQSLIAYVAAGRLTAAAEVADRLAPVIAVLFSVSNPIPVKGLLNRRGLPAGPPRLPLVPASDAELAEWGRVLAAAGL
ncbi:MAG: 4-hydroxy-tetrahydrodipicolinate synthase [Thermaerobacter sp.]|nr:4-hydroxy-tetrahydrodipicolinate synthase [Thermaerobacter sp.]